MKSAAALRNALETIVVRIPVRERVDNRRDETKNGRTSQREDQSTRSTNDELRSTRYVGTTINVSRQVSTCKNFNIESEKKFALVKVAAGGGGTV